MHLQRRESALEIIVGSVVILAIIGGAIWVNKDKRGTTETERAAARAAEQKAAAERYERKRLEERDAGVLTIPPAWATGVVPPPAEVSDKRKPVLDVGDVLVR